MNQQTLFLYGWKQLSTGTIHQSQKHTASTPAELYEKVGLTPADPTAPYGDFQAVQVRMITQRGKALIQEVSGK